VRDPTSKIFKFADDVTIVMPFSTVMDNAEIELSIIYEWSKENKMEINQNKTK
jgi:hypothetical protein